jgi:type VI secretion system protein ImpJ
MQLRQRVVWNEGMLIRPQHFQQADRYHEGLLDFRLRSLVSFDWGLTELEVDRGALENGNFNLKRCAGVMPDGLPFDIPETDAAPESRPLEKYFAGAPKILEVYLAVPTEHPGMQNCRLDGDANHRLMRYFSYYSPVLDENTNDKKQNIALAQKQLTILFPPYDSLEDYSHVKIAELIRTSAGEFKLQDNYIPPCLKISANGHLLSMLRDLRDRLSSKSNDLSEKRRKKTTRVVEFSTFDVTTFWLLHTVNSYIPVLSHYVNANTAPPERLYCELAQLAGELTTFTTDDHPKDLPEYRHLDLSYTFGELVEKIRRLIETVIPENCHPVPLEKTPESWWLGRIDNDQWFDTMEFYLAVSADVKAKDLVRDLSNKVKIGTLDDIETLVNQSLPSKVAASHTARPPAAILVKVGYQYFHLELEKSKLREGTYKDKVRKAKNLAIYIPNEFPGLKIELMAVTSNAIEYTGEETTEDESASH